MSPFSTAHTAPLATRHARRAAAARKQKNNRGSQRNACMHDAHLVVDHPDAVVVPPHEVVCALGAVDNHQRQHLWPAGPGTRPGRRARVRRKHGRAQGRFHKSRSLSPSLFLSQSMARRVCAPVCVCVCVCADIRWASSPRRASAQGTRHHALQGPPPGFALVGGPGQRREMQQSGGTSGGQGKRRVYGVQQNQREGRERKRERGGRWQAVSALGRGQHTVNLAAGEAAVEPQRHFRHLRRRPGSRRVRAIRGSAAHCGSDARTTQRG